MISVPTPKLWYPCPAIPPLPSELCSYSRTSRLAEKQNLWYGEWTASRKNVGNIKIGAEAGGARGAYFTSIPVFDPGSWRVTHFRKHVNEENRLAVGESLRSSKLLPLNRARRSIHHSMAGGQTKLLHPPAHRRIPWPCSTRALKYITFFWSC